MTLIHVKYFLNPRLMTPERQIPERLTESGVHQGKTGQSFIITMAASCWKVINYMLFYERSYLYEDISAIKAHFACYFAVDLRSMYIHAILR